MAAGAKEGKGDAAKGDEEPVDFKALMKLSTKYPTSIAFADMAETRITPEQVQISPALVRFMHAMEVLCCAA